MRLFAWVLLGVCSGFAFACTVLFSIFVFLTLFSFGGIFGYICFFAFFLSTQALCQECKNHQNHVVTYFVNFSIFSVFEKFSFWLVYVLSCQLDPRRTAAAKHANGVRPSTIWYRGPRGQPRILLNPSTIDLSLLPTHTTTHHPPNHTLPPQTRTIQPFHQDLILKCHYQRRGVRERVNTPKTEDTDTTSAIPLSLALAGVVRAVVPESETISAGSMLVASHGQMATHSTPRRSERATQPPARLLDVSEVYVAPTTPLRNVACERKAVTAEMLDIGLRPDSN